MSTSYELNAFIEEHGQRKSFYLKISEPRQSMEADDYFCCVHAPELFKRDKDIFGVDEKQAKELAFEFVKSFLNGKRIVDEKGLAINFLEKK